MASSAEPAAEDSSAFVVLCDGCEKPGAEKKCAGCRTQYYCDAQCQRVHWKAEHKKECKSWAQNLANIEAERARSLCQLDDPTAEDCAELPGDGSEPDSDECGVCFGPPRSETALPCGHKFCLSCLHEWEKHTAEAYGTGTKCPYCRGTMPGDLIGQLSSEIGLLACRANYQPPESEARLAALRAALGKADEFVEIDPEHLGLQELRASLLHDIGDHDASIAVATELMREDNVYSFQGRTVADGWVWTMRLWRRLAACHEAKDDHGEAFLAYQTGLRTLFGVADGDPSVESAKATHETRACFAGVSRCAYELGEYEMAIDMGAGAVDMNRHHHRVYEPIARAHLALGNVDAAIRTMRKAMVYETPWDETNRMRVSWLLGQLIAAREKGPTTATATGAVDEDENAGEGVA